VQIAYNRTVTHIDDDGVVYRDDHEKSHFLAADLIVVNADLPYATQSLLTNNATCRDKSIYDWNDELDYSSGVIAFHWSVDMTCEDLSTHNVFLVAASREDAENSWRVVRDDASSQRQRKKRSVAVFEAPAFNFYVHRASASDTSAAPVNCDSIMVLVPCRTLVRDENLARLPRGKAIEHYKEQFNKPSVDIVREAVLKRLSVMKGLVNLQKHIVHEVVDTPGSYA